MERAPLPPHERSWRHPSEVAAAERAHLRAEPAPASARLFALTTGTLGLLAVGVLILTVTPRRGDPPVAISATTAPVTASAAAAPGSAPSTIVALRPSGVRSGALALVDATRRVFSSASVPLATPIGDGRLAVVTRASLAGAIAGPIDVRLPSGRIASGQVVATTDHAAVVELDRAEAGRDVAEHLPRDREIVTVLSSPPVTVAFSDVDTLDVDEGTAVLDADGDLLGLCSETDSDETVLVGISSDLAGATNDAP